MVGKQQTTQEQDVELKEVKLRPSPSDDPTRAEMKQASMELMQGFEGFEWGDDGSKANSPANSKHHDLQDSKITDSKLDIDDAIGAKARALDESDKPHKDNGVGVNTNGGLARTNSKGKPRREVEIIEHPSSMELYKTPGQNDLRSEKSGVDTNFSKGKSLTFGNPEVIPASKNNQLAAQNQNQNDSEQAGDRERR